MKLPAFIAITGQEGSGKDSYGKYLAARGYWHVSAGDVLRERARSKGYTDPIPRTILSKMGDELKQEFGSGPIVNSVITDYKNREQEFPVGLVISGLRRAGELQAFKESGAVALWIEADVRARFNNQLGRERGHQSLEAFKLESDREYFGATEGGRSGVNLSAIKELADCTVKNDSTLNELFTRADTALANWQA